MAEIVKTGLGVLLLTLNKNLENHLLREKILVFYFKEANAIWAQPVEIIMEI